MAKPASSSFVGTPVSAVYYPHTYIKTEGLLKSALLLWDEVECVIPASDRSFRRQPSARLRKAAEVIAHNRGPTPDERKRVHDRLTAILARGVPGWMHREVEAGEGYDRRWYNISAGKLAPETWKLFEHYDVAVWEANDMELKVPAALGLFCMSILADEIAGQTKRRVTDRGEAYRWLGAVTTEELGGTYQMDVEPASVTPTYHRLVSLSLKTLGAKAISLDALVAMRQREAKETSTDYRALRHRYMKALDELVVSITSVEKESDVRELERQFAADLAGDLKVLKSELKLANVKALWSKEMMQTALVTAGAVVPASFASMTAGLAALGVAGVGALALTKTKVREDRTKALRDHTMSWLYLATKSA